ncbi:MAG: hypothetical protein AAGD25_25070 [Cyanobacteria bacterium P01_F01_bin.150]
MKPYSLLLATSSLLLADQWGEASVALAQTEPDLETGDEAAHIQAERSLVSAADLFINNTAQPDTPRTESFSSLNSSSSVRLAEGRSPLVDNTSANASDNALDNASGDSRSSSQVWSSVAIAQPEMTAASMQWTSRETSAVVNSSIAIAEAIAPEPSDNQASKHKLSEEAPRLPLVPKLALEGSSVSTELSTSPASAPAPAPAPELSTLAESEAPTPSAEAPALSAELSTSSISAEAPAPAPSAEMLAPSTDLSTKAQSTASSVNALSAAISSTEEPTDASSSIEAPLAEGADAETVASAYLRPPQTVPDDSVPIYLTAIPLNGGVVHHQQGWRFGQQFTTGDHRNTTLISNGSYRLGSQVRQSVSIDNVFNLDISGSFVQSNTVRRRREVTIDQRLPRRMLGLHLQQTFTGSCVGNFAEAVTEPTDQCTLTPPLVTDRESLNDFFIPTRIEQPGHVGDVISRGSLDALAAPGFQNQGVNGETVGVDLYFPNIGITERDDDGNTINVQQTEDFDQDQIVFMSRINQRIQANDARSTVGRTIRGQGFIQDDDNFWVNALVAAATELLPTVDTQLSGSLNPANTKINRNLFRAANNQWTPGNSWTLYHAGFGSTSHTSEADREAGRSPNGHYLGAWVGLSPVTKRQRSSDIYLDATGPERVLADEGGEGGSNANINFISNINGETFDSEELDAFYSQVYLRFLERDVDLVSSEKLVETTSYRPHVSFAGNVTNANQSLRYYLGAIAADDIKGYAGGDFTRHTRRWQLNVGGIGYLNPDSDYFSQVQGSVGRQFHMGDRSNITLFSGMRYALQQNSDPLEDPLDNFMSVGARTSLGPVSLGLTQYLGDVLPDAIDSTLSADLALRLSKRLAIRGYYSPINDRVNYGGSADYRLGNTVNSLVLSLGWSHRGREFGQDLEGNTLRQSDDTVTFQLQFGGKSRPFNF